MKPQVKKTEERRDRHPQDLPGQGDRLVALHLDGQEGEVMAR